MAICAIYGAENDRLNQSLSASPQSVSPQHSVPLLSFAKPAVLFDKDLS